MIPEDDDAAAARLKVIETLSANNKRRVVRGTLFIYITCRLLLDGYHLHRRVHLQTAFLSVCLSVGRCASSRPLQSLMDGEDSFICITFHTFIRSLCSKVAELLIHDVDFLNM